MDGKLRFEELDNEKVKCPLCDFTALRFERKKVYNHAFKKHKGLIYTKLTVRSTVSVEEKKAKSKLLSYERVKKFRLLKKLKALPLPDDGKEHSQADDDGTKCQRNSNSFLSESDKSMHNPRLTDSMNIFSYFESVANKDLAIASCHKTLEADAHNKASSELLEHRYSLHNINSVFHRLNILHQRVTEASASALVLQSNENE